MTFLKIPVFPAKLACSQIISLYCWRLVQSFGVPLPFRFCNNWLLSDECNQLIEATVCNFTHHGWAGFILHEQWRKVKVAVKAWHFSMQAKLKEKEKSLLSELEICDATAELVGLNEEELCFRSALQAEILSIYQIEERNLI